ncbi:MAG: PaaI family thioesterase [Phycisphaerales bacterium]
MPTSTVQSPPDPLDAPQAVSLAPAAVEKPITGRPPKRKRTLFERAEAFISKLSTRNNFWHRVCSLIWLPFAFRSGIKMKRVDPQTFTAILPFRRFNRNWYNAMAGAALLGNSEIAGGMYVFGVCGGDYTVVCKNLSYTFLRPCLGPAVYRIKPREDIHQLLKHGGEFNITIDLEVFQGITKIAPGSGAEREKRVGRCEATFHVTPKAHHKHKRERRVTAAQPAENLPATSTDAPPPPT